MGFTSLEPQAAGIREPSSFAVNLPNFDIVEGFIIEFFHKMYHVRLKLFNPIFDIVEGFIIEFLFISFFLSYFVIESTIDILEELNLSILQR